MYLKTSNNLFFYFLFNWEKTVLSITYKSNSASSQFRYLTIQDHTSKGLNRKISKQAPLIIL